MEPKAPVLFTVKVPPSISSTRSFRACARAGDIGHALCKAGDVHIARAVDDRHHKAGFGGDGDADIESAVAAEFGALPAAIEHGELAKRVADRGGEVGKECEINAFAGAEGGLLALPKGDERRDIGLDHRPRLRRLQIRRGRGVSPMVRRVGLSVTTSYSACPSGGAVASAGAGSAKGAP